MKPWLMIFLPPRKNFTSWLSEKGKNGVTWEISDAKIRTRDTKTGKVIMKASRYPGNAVEWVAAARNIVLGGAS